MPPYVGILIKINAFLTFSQEYFLCFAGSAVINAAEMGISFHLKRRDQLLDYVLTLMGRDDGDSSVDSSYEHLHTQVCVLCQSIVLNGCTVTLFGNLRYIYVDFCTILCFLLQSLALRACTTLVSIEPRLPMETRNLVMKVVYQKRWISSPFFISFTPLMKVNILTGNIRVFHITK